MKQFLTGIGHQMEIIKTLYMSTYCKYCRYIPIVMNKLAVMSCCMNVPYIYVYFLYATINNITQIFLGK